MRYTTRCHLAVLLVLQLALAGCTFFQLRSDSRELYSATVLTGRVWVTEDWAGPVVVVATTSSAGRTVIAHQVLLHEPGSYELIVPDGSYTLLAYGDGDRDGMPDAGEPAGLLPAPVNVEGTRLVSLLDFPLSLSMTKEVQRALPTHAVAPPVHSTQIAAIADLDTPPFSAESGRRGYWSPLESFRSLGGNIYFLEPYDPSRTPVLFVHGAAGSAQDWRYFVENLDRSRYQGWIFQYPSGAPLESMSHLLYWKLLNVQARFRFERLHVVAHSMGGLVARRFLLDHGNQFPQIGQFVTISTPWSGEALAALGVEHSPAVVPSWRDLQPEGTFLKHMFDRTLPAHISHTLLFGHRGGYSMARRTSDGTVTLASQLRPEAQREAHLMMGFDEDHDSILASAQVLAVVSGVLDSNDMDGEVAVRLQVELSFADGRTSAPGLATLVLQPVTVNSFERSPPLLLPVPVVSGVHHVGPIPVGEYEMSLIAPGFRGTSRENHVRLALGRALHLAFELAPEGSLSGYVVSESDKVTHPAGSYRPPEHTMELERIVLEGPSGRRVLTPLLQHTRSTAACLSTHDEAVGACFSFVDLSAGDYELTIVARGYEPHVSRHRIEPGAPTATTAVALRRRDQGGYIESP